VQESLCQYVIAAGRELIVADVASDDRIRSNPSVRQLGVAAWAGFPIRSPGGQVLGTFSVMDTVPRDWTPDIDVLETASHAVAGEIALRLAAEEATAATRQATLANAVAQAATLRAETATGDAQRAALQALEAAEEAALLSRTLQESLLPPHLPRIPGIQTAVRYLRGGEAVIIDGKRIAIMSVMRRPGSGGDRLLSRRARDLSAGLNGWPRSTSTLTPAGSGREPSRTPGRPRCVAARDRSIASVTPVPRRHLGRQDRTRSRA
jgi:hypothetical protein